MIRFLSGATARFLGGIADFPLPEDTLVETFVEDEEILDEGALLPDASVQANRLRKRYAFMDVAPETAKIFMTGFAISIITGGILYRHASTSPTMQALTGTHKLTLSPLFFVAVTFVAEFALSFLLGCCVDRSMKIEASKNEGGPVRRIVNSIVNRRVRISNSISARSPGARHPADRHDK
jgi:hypothetical protein